MTGNTEQAKVGTISLDTKIIFSLKMYLSTIGSIIGIFYLFYTLVISPSIKENKENIKSLKEAQINQLIEFNKSVTVLNSTMEKISNRFNDLNVDRNSSMNTSGNFGTNN